LTEIDNYNFEKKPESAKRSPNLRKEARIREKKSESAKRSPNSRKEARICEKKPESAKRGPNLRKEARIREKKPEFSGKTGIVLTGGEMFSKIGAMKQNTRRGR